MREDRRTDAGALLAELGLRPSLTIYLGGAPGAGKTYRLLTDALREAKAGRRVAIGWIETKRRPDLEELAALLPRISRDATPSPATATSRTSTSRPRSRATTKRSCSTNSRTPTRKARPTPSGGRMRSPCARPGSRCWAPSTSAPRNGGARRRAHHRSSDPENVPISFLETRDGVIALDVSPSVLESRLRSGPDRAQRRRRPRGDGPLPAEKSADDARTAAAHRRQPHVPVDRAREDLDGTRRHRRRRRSRAYLRRIGSLAEALDLALEMTVARGRDEASTPMRRCAPKREGFIAAAGLAKGDLTEVRAAFVSVPRGRTGEQDPDATARPRSLRRSTRRAAADPRVAARAPSLRPDRRRPPAHRVRQADDLPGLDRGQRQDLRDARPRTPMREEGVDVVAALVETHGRAETAAKTAGIEQIPRLPNNELDAKRSSRAGPAVALIDELAHTNAPRQHVSQALRRRLRYLTHGITVDDDAQRSTPRRGG